MAGITVLIVSSKSPDKDHINELCKPYLVEYRDKGLKEWRYNDKGIFNFLWDVDQALVDIEPLELAKKSRYTTQIKYLRKKTYQINITILVVILILIWKVITMKGIISIHIK